MSQLKQFSFLVWQL